MRTGKVDNESPTVLNKTWICCWKKAVWHPLYVFITWHASSVTFTCTEKYLNY